MANEKYDNLMAMLGSGKLNWVSDKIDAYLFEGSSFEAASVRLSEVEGTKVTNTPIPGRSVDAVGSFLGLPAAFNSVVKDTTYEVVVVKDDGSGDPWLISYYDGDQGGAPLVTVNNGTLLVRPVAIPEAFPPTLGVWVQFVQF